MEQELCEKTVDMEQELYEKNYIVRWKHGWHLHPTWRGGALSYMLEEGSCLLEEEEGCLCREGHDDRGSMEAMEATIMSMEEWRNHCKQADGTLHL